MRDTDSEIARLSLVQLRSLWYMERWLPYRKIPTMVERTYYRAVLFHNAQIYLRMGSRRVESLYTLNEREAGILIVHIVHIEHSTNYIYIYRTQNCLSETESSIHSNKEAINYYNSAILNQKRFKKSRFPGHKFCIL